MCLVSLRGNNPIMVLTLNGTVSTIVTLVVLFQYAHLKHNVCIDVHGLLKTQCL